MLVIRSMLLYNQAQIRPLEGVVLNPAGKVQDAVKKEI